MLERFRGGRSLIISDVDQEPELAGPAGEGLSPAGIAVPLMRGGQWVASLYVSQAEPRQWQQEDVALVEAVAETAWDSVERTEAVARLRDSEAQFRAITNSIDDMVWSSRPDGHVDFYNDRWYQFTGVPSGSTDGSSWANVLHPDDVERAGRTWQHSLATGEPYIVFSDTVNRMMPKHHRELGLKVSTSNLCAEITLPTGIDHLGNDRTAVCCLSSLNLEKWDEWSGDKQFIEDIMRFLDNVLQDYIDRAPDQMARAKYSAMRERSVGLGVMGFHSFLQAKSIGFESPMAKVWNLKMFKHISAKAEEASLVLAQERGPCPDAAETGAMERFSCKMAIAPTASISIICGGTSACIEPIPANIYTHKTLSGSFIVKNPYLQELLAKKSKDSTNVWNSILEHGGSVAHLDFLTPEEKATYKTSFEIDQRWLLELAADRAPYIDQAQSLNLFIPADVEKWDLLMLHFRAWELGIKSLYYLRSKSVQRAQCASIGRNSAAVQPLRRLPCHREASMVN